MMEYRGYINGELRRERATAHRGPGDTKLTRTVVKSATGVRSEMLPADPYEVARILKERRTKSPAATARARLAKDAAKRVAH